MPLPTAHEKEQTMSRYIDADVMIANALQDSERLYLESVAKHTPSIDIVRCKECDMSEVYQSDSNGVMARYCKAFTPTRMIADDDYCSYGERSE